MEQYRFRIDIPEKDLTDLRTRLKNVKWPDDPDNQDWGYGVNAGYLKELVSYWLNDFGWRKVEERINRYRQYRVFVDGVPIHFIYQKGRGRTLYRLFLRTAGHGHFGICTK